MNTVNQAPETISSIQGIISKIQNKSVDAEIIIEDTRRLISEIDGAIKAWQTLNWDHVSKQLDFLVSRQNWRFLPLASVPIAVKDVYDTADFVTTYGSTIYENHRPLTDAKLVAILSDCSWENSHNGICLLAARSNCKSAQHTTYARRILIWFCCRCVLWNGPACSW